MPATRLALLLVGGSAARASCEATDALGVTRKDVVDSGVDGVLCDSGAFELISPPR